MKTILQPIILILLFFLLSSCGIGDRSEIDFLARFNTTDVNRSLTIALYPDLNSVGLRLENDGIIHNGTEWYLSLYNKTGQELYFKKDCISILSYNQQSRSWEKVHDKIIPVNDFSFGFEEGLEVIKPYLDGLQNPIPIRIVIEGYLGSDRESGKFIAFIDATLQP